ncbi:MAG: glutamate 5-kinase [Anaerolineae bacterium]
MATGALSQRWHRIVVKVGTSTLTAGTPRLSPPRMVSLVRQLAALRLAGHDVVLVSSGAQQAGRERLGYPQESKSIPFKQMLAAVGQGRLMHLWEQYFDIYDLVVAQVLMTREDVEDRQRYLNLRDTFDSLLQRGIVPIVNENDAVATDEIRVGENDSLSAMVANAVEADLLILLTDRDGVYTADPQESEEARLIPRIETIDADLYALAKGSRSGLGRGGMYTKILAAEMATRSGTHVVVANGNREDVIGGVLEDKIPCTWFFSHITPAEGRKRWLVAQTSTAGTIVIDAGAARALVENGRSLLPVGIVRWEGTFERGEVVSVEDPAGNEIARGLCSYGSDDLAKIAGRQSQEVAEILGYNYGNAFIHRDKLVIL